MFRCDVVKITRDRGVSELFGHTVCDEVFRHRLARSAVRDGGTMKKALAITLVAGFLLVDFLFFHDIFKPGETVTFAQYLTGVLSIPVLVLSALYLTRGTSAIET
jgi:hypothetical protein